MDSINEKIYKANIELQDENKLLKQDKKILQKRIQLAINLYENEDYSTLVDDMYKILKGEYFNE